MTADCLLIVWLVACTLRFVFHPVRWLVAMIRFFDAIPWKFVYFIGFCFIVFRWPIYTRDKHRIHAHRYAIHTDRVEGWGGKQA